MKIESAINQILPGGTDSPTAVQPLLRSRRGLSTMPHCGIWYKLCPVCGKRHIPAGEQACGACGMVKTDEVYESPEATRRMKRFEEMAARLPWVQRGTFTELQCRGGYKIHIPAMSDNKASYRVSVRGVEVWRKRGFPSIERVKLVSVRRVLYLLQIKYMSLAEVLPRTAKGPSEKSETSKKS